MKIKKRNNKIFVDYLNDRSVNALMKEHEISRERIRQVILKNAELVFQSSDKVSGEIVQTTTSIRKNRKLILSEFYLLFDDNGDKKVGISVTIDPATTIDNLPLSNRVKNSLRLERIENLAQLSTFAPGFRFYNMGKKSHEEIESLFVSQNNTQWIEHKEKRLQALTKKEIKKNDPAKIQLRLQEKNRRLIKEDKWIEHVISMPPSIKIIDLPLNDLSKNVLVKEGFVYYSDITDLSFDAIKSLIKHKSVPQLVKLIYARKNDFERTKYLACKSSRDDQLGFSLFTVSGSKEPKIKLTWAWKMDEYVWITKFIGDEGQVDEIRSVFRSTFDALQINSVWLIGAYVVSQDLSKALMYTRLNDETMNALKLMAESLRGMEYHSLQQAYAKELLRYFVSNIELMQIYAGVTPNFAVDVVLNELMIIFRANTLIENGDDIIDDILRFLDDHSVHGPASLSQKILNLICSDCRQKLKLVVNEITNALHHSEELPIRKLPEKSAVLPNYFLIDSTGVICLNVRALESSVGSVSDKIVARLVKKSSGFKKDNVTPMS